MVVLGVHLVVLNVLGAHRPEGAQPHVEGDKPQLDPLRLYPLQQLWGKVQPGGGGGGGAHLPGVHRLVPLPVLELFLNIGGQGHLADLVQQIEENPLVLELDEPVAVGEHVHHLTAQQPVPKGEPAALPGFFPGPARASHRSFPLFSSSRNSTWAPVSSFTP